MVVGDRCFEAGDLVNGDLPRDRLPDERRELAQVGNLIGEAFMPARP
jgi:hypothetical protein